MPLLSNEEAERRLPLLDGWVKKGSSISKRFKFRRFTQGIEFINTVAALAEKEDHHPDIHVKWRTVTLELMTHDEGGLTERDFKMAKKLDRLKPKGLQS